MEGGREGWAGEGWRDGGIKLQRKTVDSGSYWSEICGFHLNPADLSPFGQIQNSDGGFLLHYYIAITPMVVFYCNIILQRSADFI